MHALHCNVCFYQYQQGRQHESTNMNDSIGRNIVGAGTGSSTDYNEEFVRRPDAIRTERLLSSNYNSHNRNNHYASDHRYSLVSNMDSNAHTHNSNNHTINEHDNQNSLMRNVGSSALLGSAIGALSGYTHNRSVLNSALEGAVAGAVGGAISNHLNSSLSSSSMYDSAGMGIGVGNNGNRVTTRYHSNHPQNFHSSLSSLYPLSHSTRMLLELSNPNNTINGDNVDQMSYERLLEVFGDGSDNRGASTTTLSALPTKKIQNVEKELPLDCRKCAICLEDFENGQERKTLECLHGFHNHCIDRWLISNACCPICKHHVGG
mmetsp:Transcript_21208/g.26093  ORF Transcript_21208/g.26093 Transcript_21208/m.26093 type:complete len:320 (-) Transcript_21208:277-1236(-)